MLCFGLPDDFAALSVVECSFSLACAHCPKKATAATKAAANRERLPMSGRACDRRWSQEDFRYLKVPAQDIAIVHAVFMSFLESYSFESTLYTPHTDSVWCVFEWCNHLQHRIRNLKNDFARHHIT